MLRLVHVHAEHCKKYLQRPYFLNFCEYESGNVDLELRIIEQPNLRLKGQAQIQISISPQKHVFNQIPQSS